MLGQLPATLKLPPVSRGFGATERAVLDALADRASQFGHRWRVPALGVGRPSGRPAVEDEEPDEPDLDYGSTWSIRRAMHALERKDWLELWLERDTTYYVRRRPEDEGKPLDYDKALDQHFSPVTGRQVSFETSRWWRVASFRRVPHSLIEARLTEYFLEQFEELLEIRQGSVARGDSPDVRHQTSRLLTFKERDQLRWRDAMGPGLKVEWVYFRWEAGRGGLTPPGFAL